MSRRVPTDVRTYGDLIAHRNPSSNRGTCCACHKWDKPTWQLSTRASICKGCCEKKSDQTLGSIVTAERKARRWVKGHWTTSNAAFIAHISGVSVEYVEGLIAKERGAAIVRDALKGIKS